MCGQTLTLQDIATSTTIRPIGMLFDPELEIHLFFFQHEVSGCGTCFTIPALELSDLVDEPISAKSLIGMGPCERHCARIDDLSPCRQTCRFAPFRRLLIRLLKKRAATNTTSVG